MRLRSAPLAVLLWANIDYVEATVSCYEDEPYRADNVLQEELFGNDEGIWQAYKR